jgi:hypothetical protein
MKGTKRYSIGAGIADFYVAGTISAALGAIYVAVNHRLVPIWEPFLAIALVLAVVIIYYAVVARRVAFLTPGEIMMGRVVTAGCKHWTNPFGIDRSALFAVLFMALIGAGNAFDSATDGRFYTTLTAPVVAGRMVFIGALLAGTVMVGRARAAGGALVVGYFALTAAGILLGKPPGMMRMVGWSVLFMALVAGVILWRYQRAAAGMASHPIASTAPREEGVGEPGCLPTDGEEDPR